MSDGNKQIPGRKTSHRIRISVAMAMTILTWASACLVASAQGPVYTNAVLTDSPLGYYRMSETTGTTAFDTTTPAENGSYQNGVTLGVAGPQPGAFPGLPLANTGASFDGVNDRLEVTSLTTLNDTAYSYEVWVNYVSNGGLQYFGGRGSGASLAYDSVGVNNQTLLFFNGSAAVFDAGISQNAWHHLVYTRDNTDVKVYVDGVQRISTTSSITYGTSDRIVLGERPGDVVSVNASFDELAIYDAALTAQQVADHYAAAFVPEPSAVLLLGVGALLLWRRMSQQK